MSETIIPRDQAAQNLAVSVEVLMRYEARGLIRTVNSGSVTGYEPTEIRRIWRVLSFQRDLGINLAGVEVLLRLRDQVDELHHQLHQFSLDLQAALEEREAEGDSSDEQVH